jgi:hypothetical protein
MRDRSIRGDLRQNDELLDFGSLRHRLRVDLEVQLDRLTDVRERYLAGEIPATFAMPKASGTLRLRLNRFAATSDFIRR